MSVRHLPRALEHGAGRDSFRWGSRGGSEETKENRCQKQKERLARQRMEENVVDRGNGMSKSSEVGQLTTSCREKQVVTSGLPKVH